MIASIYLHYVDVFGSTVWLICNIDILDMVSLKYFNEHLLELYIYISFLNYYYFFFYII